MITGRFVDRVISGLKGHQEAVLAFAMAFLACALYMKNGNPYVSPGIPGAFYIAYILRMWLLDKHNERVAQMEVNRLESGKGKSITARTVKKSSKARSGTQTG